MSHIRFKKEEVSTQVQEIFKDLFNRVSDNASLSSTEANDTEVVFSSDPHLIPLYYLTIGDVETAQEYM